VTLSRVALFEHSAVASEQPLASLAGYQTLREGGNAFDAVAATAFALAVTFHPAGGMGGDFFAMAYEAKTGKVHCLNSNGWSPSGLTLDLIASKGEKGVPLFGPFSIVVPGFVGGVLELHKKFGSAETRKLLAPALSYAREGFPAGAALCRSIGLNLGSLSREAREVFAPSGRPPSPGEWIKQEKLGRVIASVIEGGADAFYKGWPAEKTSGKLTNLGVSTTMHDMDFKPEWVQPLTFDYRGTTVHENPPSSMGATSLLMLKSLSQKDLKEASPASLERMKLTMEAAELAYERKSTMVGDPRFSSFNFHEFMKLGGSTHKGVQRLGSGDTTAFSVADREGNLVSAIQSLYHHFGSRVFVDECGMMLSNRGAGFSTDGPNKLEPRKRPLHTLSALLLSRRDEPLMAIGSSGGDYRPMQHALFVTNLVDYSMPLGQSIDYPRFLWSGGREVIAEAGYPTSGLPDYDIQPLAYPGATGVCHAVQVLARAKKAVCDVRGDGVPAGF
jgi:gamma-glutamyltranspeptidase/glutathione hydrolase